MADTLPATDDPYELLGVSAEADGRELKRAYVRLIKKYKPEQFPEEFQRIQRAYEAVRDEAREAERRPSERRHEELEPDEPRARRPTIFESAPRTQRERSARPAARLDAYDAHDASAFDPSGSDRSETAQQAARSAEEPPPAEHASVLATRDVLMLRAAGELERMRERLDELHREGALTWEALGTRPDAANAVWLFEEHVDRELLSGRGAELLAWVASARLEHELLRVPELESVVWRILAFTCWSDPERTLTVLRAHPGAPGTSDANLDVLEATLPHADLYRQVREKLSLPEALTRLLELGRLEARPGPHVAQPVASALVVESAAMLGALDQLHDKAPTLLGHVLATADVWAPPDDRLLHEMSPPERAWLGGTMTELDQALAANALNKLSTGFVLVLMLWSLWGFIQFGLWGGLGNLLASFVVLMISVSKVDAFLYPRIVRPLIIERAIARGVSPDRLVEWLANNSKLSDDVGRFSNEIERDLPLYALSSLHRMRLDLRSTAAVATQAGGPAVDTSPSVTMLAPAALPGSRQARTDCEMHPGTAIVGYCGKCARAACVSCAPPDPDVSVYCPQCSQARSEALRKALGPVEFTFRMMASLFWFSAGLAVLATVTAFREQKTKAAWIALALTVALFALGAVLRRFWPTARLLSVPFASAALLAFPFGTFLAVRTLRATFSARGKRVFSPEYSQVIAATPKLGPRRYYLLLDAAAVALAGFAAFTLLT